MFLNFIKDFGLKKIIKKTLSNYKAAASPDRVITIGILLDESYFAGKDALINELVNQGVSSKSITTLSFLEGVKKGQVVDCCYFTRKDISAGGTFEKQDVATFINTPFDLLISYYDVAKPPLVLATLKSNATFKVGFATVDNRLNSFMIASQAERYKEFTEELLKYLRILNKL
jgi:hypothetical protein